jgi:hypothetical protein
MTFINWLAQIIAMAVTEKVVLLLKEERDQSVKINSIATEAKSLMGELDAAQSESEKKAILRKIANFSNVSRGLL